MNSAFVELPRDLCQCLNITLISIKY